MSKCIKVSYHNRYDEEINILCPHIKEIKTCKIVCKSRFSDFVILEFNSNKNEMNIYITSVLVIVGKAVRCQF